ncbi:MAG: hypothetical protein MJ117_04695 [Lachnospiraceae bacterium]|nr:hypothetical protein [Lachnospiraceae bacterium]
MKKFNTLAVCGVLSMSMAASVLTGCGDKAVDGTQTAMVIDGDEISLGMANYVLRTEQANTYAQMQGMLAYFGGDGKSFWSLEGDDGVTYGEAFKDSTVDNLTSLVEIRKHAEEMGVSVSEEEEQKLQEAAKAFLEKNTEAMEKLGVSQENIQEALELQTLEIKIRPEVIANVDREVSDEEAAQTTVTYVRLAKPKDDEAALKTAKEQMEQVLEDVKNAKAGADLGEIGDTVNEDCYSAQYHFNQGVYDEENNVLETAVKDVLPGLKDGEVYDKVIEGDSYLYVIRMDHNFDREKTDAQKETIIRERENTLYTETIEGWTEGITAETKDCWNKIVVDDNDPYVLNIQG